MSIKLKIMQNLNGRVNRVNTLVALHGLDWLEAGSALDELVNENLVEVTNFNDMEGMGLYRLTRKGYHTVNNKLTLAVDNTTKR